MLGKKPHTKNLTNDRLENSNHESQSMVYRLLKMVDFPLPCLFLCMWSISLHLVKRSIIFHEPIKMAFPWSHFNSLTFWRISPSIFGGRTWPYLLSFTPKVYCRYNSDAPLPNLGTRSPWHSGTSMPFMSWRPVKGSFWRHVLTSGGPNISETTIHGILGIFTDVPSLKPTVCP